MVSCFGMTADALIDFGFFFVSRSGQYHSVLRVDVVAAFHKDFLVCSACIVNLMIAGGLTFGFVWKS